MNARDEAIEYVMGHEGEFVDNPSDSGGATNFGLSLRFLRQLPVERLRKYGIFRMGDALTVDDIKNLTTEQAKLIYAGEFWDQAPFDQIKNDIIAKYIFDTCILDGVTEGIKIAQRALWAAYQRRDFVKDDGVLGTKTISAINTIAFSPYLAALIAERAGFFRLLALKRPKDGEFLNGWLNRCYNV